MSAVATAIVGSAVVGAVASNSASKRASKAMQGQSDAAMLQAEIAKEQWDRYKEIYAPLEDQYVQDAQNFDSPEEYARAAGEASATVSQQFGKARDRLARTPGLDPSSAAFQAGITGLELSQAATDATTQNAARDRTRDMAWARRTDALSIGKGLPANASSGLSNAANGFGNVANAQANLASSQATNAGQFVSGLFNAGQQAGWFTPRFTPDQGLIDASMNNIAANTAVKPLVLG